MDRVDEVHMDGLANLYSRKAKAGFIDMMFEMQKARSEAEESINAFNDKATIEGATSAIRNLDSSEKFYRRAHAIAHESFGEDEDDNLALAQLAAALTGMFLNVLPVIVEAHDSYIAVSRTYHVASETLAP